MKMATIRTMVQQICMDYVNEYIFDGDSYSVGRRWFNF